MQIHTHLYFCVNVWVNSYVRMYVCIYKSIHHFLLAIVNQKPQRSFILLEKFFGFFSCYDNKLFVDKNKTFPIRFLYCCCINCDIYSWQKTKSQMENKNLKMNERKKNWLLLGCLVGWFCTKTIHIYSGHCH